MTNSRISGFYNMTLEERRAKLGDGTTTHLTPESLLPFTTGGLSPEAADHMIENVIGLYSLPLGIALNFQVNGRDVLVPMTLEEPSVVAGASFMAKLARAGGLPDWVKLEVIPDPRYLLPDPVETLRAASALVEEGFTVLPYILPDPVLAKKLEEVGCATVMPLAAPIGSGRGLKLRDSIRIVVEQAEVPVVVDAGLGAPSHAAESMEMGADAVLVNTAIARADDPVAMAEAFRLGVEAGRRAFLAGVMDEQEPTPSSPVGGTV